MGQSEVENEGLPGQATGYITLLQDKAMGFKTGSGELDWGVPECRGSLPPPPLSDPPL